MKWINDFAQSLQSNQVQISVSILVVIKKDTSINSTLIVDAIASTSYVSPYVSRHDFMCFFFLTSLAKMISVREYAAAKTKPCMKSITWYNYEAIIKLSLSAKFVIRWFCAFDSCLENEKFDT